MENNTNRRTTRTKNVEKINNNGEVFITRDLMDQFEKRLETKISYEVSSVKFDILCWMIPFHLTTLAFMLTMLYRVFS